MVVAAAIAAFIAVWVYFAVGLAAILCDRRPSDVHGGSLVAAVVAGALAFALANGW